MAQSLSIRKVLLREGEAKNRKREKLPRTLKRKRENEKKIEDKLFSTKLQSNNCVYPRTYKMSS